MRILSSMKKIALFICIAVCSLCGFGVIAEQNEQVEVKAETTASVTMEWRGLDTSGSTLDYMYIHFAGFNTKTNYDGDANSDYVFQNIKLNGVSLYDINENTDVSGWTWDTFPQVNYSPVEQYRKPVHGYIKDTKGRIQLRFHKSFLDPLVEKDGYMVVTVCEGFTLNGYTIDKETSYRLEKDDSTYGGTFKSAEKTPTMDWRGAYTEGVTLDYCYIGFAGFTTKDDYMPKTMAKADNAVDITGSVSVNNWITQSELKVTYISLGTNVLPNGIDYGLIDKDGYLYAQDYIAINGRTVREINTDASLGAQNWTYTVFPSTLEGTKYKIPIIMFVNNNMIEVKLHSEYLKLLGDSVEVTVKAGLYFQNGATRYEVTADKSFVVWSEVPMEEVDITEGIAVQGWAPTGDASELTYTRITFDAGVLPETIDYGVLDKFDWQYMMEYIVVNGKTIKEINETTDTSDYQFSTFPSTADSKYRLPIIIFENNNALELKFHNTYLNAVGDDLEITVKEGLSIVNGNTKYIVKKDVEYILSGDTWSDKNRMYTITYFVNGEQYGEIEQLPYNSPLVLRDDVATEKGFVFSGWECSSTAVVVQNMEIHGYIRPIRYTITYHLDGGVNNANNPIVYYATDGEIVLKDATKEGAEFKGWYTSEDYTQKVEKLSVENLGDMQLYALFEGGAVDGESGCASTTITGSGIFAVVGFVLLAKKRRKA